MRISLLLRREPFGDILVRTLEEFLPTVSGRRHQVRWLPGRPGRIGKNGSRDQLWLCNPYLNAIFRPGAPRSALEPVLREFSRSPIWWRRPLQRIYVELASRNPFAPFLAQAALHVSPGVPGADGLVILGGNHKIRVLNRDAQTVYGVLKHGYDRRFLKNEIATRKAAESLGLPVPELRETDASDAWFSEAYVIGTPINRLGDQDLAGAALKRTCQELGRLYDATTREVPISEYAGPIVQRIRERIQKHRLLRDEDKARVSRCVDAIENHLAPHRNRRIATALTHGDFQPANVLVDAGQVYLIDWEYSGRRQVAYDLLVYSLASRFPVGAALRFGEFCSAGVGLPAIAPFPAIAHQDCREHPKSTILLFLLEEFDLHLTASDNGLLQTVDGSFLDLTRESHVFLTKVMDQRH